MPGHQTCDIPMSEMCRRYRCLCRQRDKNHLRQLLQLDQYLLRHLLHRRLPHQCLWYKSEEARRQVPAEARKSSTSPMMLKNLRNHAGGYTNESRSWSRAASMWMPAR